MMDRQEKIRMAAQALMKDDPGQWADCTLEEAMQELSSASDEFLDHAILWFDDNLEIVH